MSSLVSQPRTTLVDVLLPRSRSWLFDIVLVVAFSAFVALSARIAIPWWPVPMTLQPLAVLFTGAVLGSRRGALALLLYLAEGAVGLPVFAGGAGVAWLAVFLGDLETALIQGMLIFIPGDLIKIAIATLALPGGWALARRGRDHSEDGT